MNYLDYDSNNEDDCSVDDVEYEADHYDEHDNDLPAVSDLEFIAANAADSFEFVNTGAVAMEQEAANVNSAHSESDDDSDDDSEPDMAVEETEAVAASSSSDSSSDSEDEIISKKQYQKKNRQISMLTEEEGDEAATGPLKTKNELEEEIELVEAKQLEIKDSAELVCVGEVKYRIDHECVVVIQADYTTNALNEGSVLCNIDGKVLGKIQEIFGPITTPFYTVRWKSPSAQGNNSNAPKRGNDKSNKNNKRGKKKPVTEETSGTTEEGANAEPAPEVVDAVGIEIEKDESLEVKAEAVAMEEAVETSAAGTGNAGAEVKPEAAVVSEAPKATAAGLEISDVRALFPVGAKLYTVQAHCSYVLAAQMQKARAKGSDASNAYDEEPPEEELEYSDDEQEMAARAARKQAKKGTAQAQSDAASFGDAIPSGQRPGANKRGAGGFNKPISGRGNFGQPQHHGQPHGQAQGQAQYGHQQGMPQGQGYGGVPQYGQMQPGYVPMNPTYMGGQYMPQQQQPFYGQQMQQMPGQYPMHPYGASNPGFPMQYAQNPHMYPQQGYSQQQQHMYPPQQPMMPQYTSQPGFIPAAAFVPGAYSQNQGGASAQQGAQQPAMPQYQYQPLQFNNGPGAKK